MKNLTEPGDKNENKMMTIKVEHDEKRMVKQESRNGRNAENQCQILIPMTPYVEIAAQVPAGKR